MATSVQPGGWLTVTWPPNSRARSLSERGVNGAGKFVAARSLRSRMQS
jgi:hypothetical protein